MQHSVENVRVCSLNELKVMSQRFAVHFNNTNVCNKAV